MGIAVRDSQGEFFFVAEEGVSVAQVESLEKHAQDRSLSPKGAALAAELAQKARLWNAFMESRYAGGGWEDTPMLGLPAIIRKATDADERITELRISSRSLAEHQEALRAWKKNAQTLNRELRRAGQEAIETNFAEFFLKIKPAALAALSVETAKAENFIGAMDGYCAYFPEHDCYFERQSNGRWDYTELLARATPFESASAAQTFMRRKGLYDFVIVQTRLQAVKIAANPTQMEIGKLAGAMARAEAESLQEALDAQSLHALRERAQQLAERLAQMEAAAAGPEGESVASLAPAAQSVKKRRL